MRVLFPVFLAVFTGSAFAQETRQLDAHEHGVGLLNMAVDGTGVAMEFMAPGADIVGFEHAAGSAEDRAAIEAAVARLARPLELFALPEAAECTVTRASAELEGGAAHDEEHGHEHEEEHAEDHGDDHGDDHAELAEAAGEGTGHTEFHAEYLLSCANPGAITGIELAYFEAFPNARAVRVQIVLASGARAFEVERDVPVLDLRGLY